MAEERGWLVGCFGLNGPLRQYFSLYRAVSQREGERKMTDERKTSKQLPPAPTVSAVGPRPTIIQISRTPPTTPEERGVGTCSFLPGVAWSGDLQFSVGRCLEWGPAVFCR